MDSNIITILDAQVLFVKLEDLLVYDSAEEIDNLQLLMRIRRTKRKGSKRKSSTAVFNYVYLRPFVKPFLMFVSRHFKLILYSYKDSKTLEAVTDSVNGLFPHDIFEAYISLPESKQG